MAKLELMLITGRSAMQGIGISSGKDLSEYRNATRTIDLNPADMQRLGLISGDCVQLESEHGTAVATCRSSEIPEGLAFMAFGPVCNRLIGDETFASGMPDSKHVKVQVAKAASN